VSAGAVGGLFEARRLSVVIGYEVELTDKEAFQEEQNREEPVVEKENTRDRRRARWNTEGIEKEQSERACNAKALILTKAVRLHGGNPGREKRKLLEL
jgi:hypothetical protein